MTEYLGEDDNNPSSVLSTRRREETLEEGTLECNVHMSCGPAGGGTIPHAANAIQSQWGGEMSIGELD